MARTPDAAELLGRAGALVIAEPTGNAPLHGPKRAFWPTGKTRGVTAHGSMPECGDSAIYKIARAARLGDAAPERRTVSCFTAAAARLRLPLGMPRSAILEPGEPEMAHQTDKYSRVDRIGEAHALFVGPIDDWCAATSAGRSRVAPAYCNWQ